MAAKYLSKRIDGRLVHIHRLVAEQAIGRLLVGSEKVHHANRKRYDNRPQNLVICPDESYHRLLHLRLDAFEATGDPEKRKCQICKQFDDLANLYEKPAGNEWRHRACFNVSSRTNSRKEGEQKYREANRELLAAKARQRYHAKKVMRA